jgi:hypothetical protein
MLSPPRAQRPVNVLLVKAKVMGEFLIFRSGEGNRVKSPLLLQSCRFSARWLLLGDAVDSAAAFSVLQGMINLPSRIERQKGATDGQRGLLVLQCSAQEEVIDHRHGRELIRDRRELCTLPP